MTGSTLWHAIPAADALRERGTSNEGLSEDEAQRRLATFGPNRASEIKGRGPILRFLSQFNNVLIYVLLGAALVTALLAHWLDTAVILGVVVINAVIGFIQEGRAEEALAAIRNLLAPTATVVRNGARARIAAERLVPGDIVLVESGDRVPADLRLVRAKALQIQEAILTGESVAVSKGTDPVEAEVPLGDRISLAFAGTLVTHGAGAGVVVETGDRTEIGKVGQMLAQIEPLSTPLLGQMDRFGRWLSLGIVLVAAATFAVGVLVHGQSATEMFLAAVGLAVAAIPEGLPAIMTITLAIGVERMARRQAIIRRLPAVETLGCVTVICSDKTGTFTHNEMTVKSLATSGHFFAVTGSGYRPKGALLHGETECSIEQMPRLKRLIEGAILCSDAELKTAGDDWSVDGDPMEGALLVLGLKAGADITEVRHEWPRIDEIPFDLEHRFMATLHQDDEVANIIYVKGAPETIAAMCDRQQEIIGEKPYDPGYWQALEAEMTGRGERVLAIAMKRIDRGQDYLSFGDMGSGMTLLGMLGLTDPPRDEAIKAVAACRAAGIQVKLITGDHAGTARAIAKQIGLANTERVVTGPEIDRPAEDEVVTLAAGSDVFARTSPNHKLHLVEALQAEGHVVAMTGDGVNDAPALKRADVGIAMGQKGSEAAKEAAEMVLTDDNFASIAAAVEEGRTVYDNLKKTILFILPTNGGEGAVILAAVMSGMVLPITAVQILWVNMVTAVTLGLALAFEDAEGNVMKRKPRRVDEPILSPFLIWRILAVSAILVAGVFGLFRWLIDSGADEATARTAAVNVLVLFEVFYLFNVRRLHNSAFHKLFHRSARPIWIAAAIVLLIQIPFTYFGPMQTLFKTSGLDLWVWGVAALIAASVFVFVEVEKVVYNRWLDGRRRRA